MATKPKYEVVLAVQPMDRFDEAGELRLPICEVSFVRTKTRDEAINEYEKAMQELGLYFPYPKRRKKK